MYLCLCMFTCVRSLQGQMWTLDPLELELKEFVNHLTCALGTKLQSSTKVVSPLNC